MCPFFLTTLTPFTYFVQGDLFNWRPPKNHKFLLVSECFQKKVRVSRLAPPLKSLSVGLAPPFKVLSVSR